MLLWGPLRRRRAASSALTQEASETLRWWWQQKLQSPDDATRRQALEKLIVALQDPDHESQRNAAATLATIGHPLALQWLVQNAKRSDEAEWTVGVLDQIVAGFSRELHATRLAEIADFADPMQTISSTEVTPDGKPLAAAWQTYRAIDCSSLRRKAETELKRREKALEQRQKTEEESKQQRQAVKALAKRKSA